MKTFDFNNSNDQAQLSNAVQESINFGNLEIGIQLLQSLFINPPLKQHQTQFAEILGFDIEEEEDNNYPECQHPPIEDIIF